MGPRAIPIVLLALAAAPGCRRPVPPPPPPPPAGPEAPPGTDWLETSPLRAAMRAMWLDCGAVLSAARDPSGTAADEIECAARDVVRKAARAEALWRAVESEAGRLALAARWEPRERAADRRERLSTACCDCHVEYWPGRLRGMAPETLRAWERGTAAHTDGADGADGEEAPPLAPDPNPVQEEMRDLLAALSDFDSRLGAGDADGAATVAGSVERRCRERAEAWAALRAAAEALTERARADPTGSFRAPYEAMAGRCTSCHATSVRDRREPLDPPQWR